VSAKGALDPVWPGSGSDPHSSLPIFLSLLALFFHYIVGTNRSSSWNYRCHSRADAGPMALESR
jgi:hypothetical protein